MEAEFIRIARDCWSSMLGLDARLIQAMPAKMEGQKYLSSCVQFTGSWEGAVVVDCTEVLARRVAAAMFGLDSAELGDVEVEDAIGEVANVVGGNVKTILPPQCQLSVPAVVVGGDYTLRLPKSEVVGMAVLESEAESVRFTLRKHETGASAGG